MLVYKRWDIRTHGMLRYQCDGWFLFGFIPLYTRKIKQS